MNLETNLIKRIFTSIILLLILFCSIFINKNLWLVLLLISSIICFIEFRNLINKMFSKIHYIFLSNILSLLYIIIFVYCSYNIYNSPPYLLIFTLLICIFSDTGGYVIGKTIGGKKLTKISPNKTISGSIGSFVFSLIPAIIFLNLDNSLDFFVIIFSALVISFICQCGDLLISILKRIAKVKDTGSVLPGHGGLLDRIDGILFVIPLTYYFHKLYIIS